MNRSSNCEFEKLPFNTPSKSAPTLSVLCIVTITALYTVTPVLFLPPHACMHVRLLYQTRSREDLQLQEAANHRHRYRMHVLSKERIMSYKEQGVGVGILSYKMEGIGEGMFEVDSHA